jgi:hypothetical protein
MIKSNRRFDENNPWIKRLNLVERLCELKYRATGRTTRLVDEYIQKLYSKPDEWIGITDHFWNYKTGKTDTRANVMLFRKLMHRLSDEHPNDKFDYRKNDNHMEVRLVSSASDEYINEEIKRLEKELIELKQKNKNGFFD